METIILKLLKVYDLYHQFRRELLEHYEKEEMIVFPLIKKLAENTVQNREEAIGLITELEKEHDIAGSILKELSHNYFRFCAST